MISFIFAVMTLTAVELDCMAVNVYHEARNEPISGMYAVMDVVHNRVKHKAWPNNVCAVIYQKAQFSWTAKPLKIKNKKKLKEIKKLVVRYTKGLNRGESKGALWYHATYVKPKWSKKLKVSRRIGQHIFYKKL